MSAEHSMEMLKVMGVACISAEDNVEHLGTF